MDITTKLLVIAAMALLLLQGLFVIERFILSPSKRILLSFAWMIGVCVAYQILTRI